MVKIGQKYQALYMKPKYIKISHLTHSKIKRPDV